MKNNIVSLSGGKDSTAMVLEALERDIPIHSILFFDGGWEFPQMSGHIDRLESYTGLSVQRIKPAESFEYWMLERPIIARKGPKKGKVRGHGHGWPSFTRRWCTRQKAVHLDKAIKDVPNAVKWIGFAADEQKRAEGGMAAKGRYAKFEVRYPLIEWQITEADALAICRRHGFDWDGLYDIFPRVSCFCCPLQSIGELRKVRRHFPDLWAKMLKWDTARASYNKGFLFNASVHDLEARFAEDDRHIKLPGLDAA